VSALGDRIHAADFVPDPATPFDELANSVHASAFDLVKQVLTGLGEQSDVDPASPGFLTQYAAAAGIGLVLMAFSAVFAVVHSMRRGGRDDLRESLFKYLPAAVFLLVFSPAIGVLVLNAANAATRGVADWGAATTGNAASRVDALAAISADRLPGGTFVGLVVPVLIVAGALGVFLVLAVAKIGLPVAGIIAGVGWGMLVHPLWRPRAMRVPALWLGLVFAKPALFLVLAAAFGALGDPGRRAGRGHRPDPAVPAGRRVGRLRRGPARPGPPVPGRGAPVGGSRCAGGRRAGRRTRTGHLLTGPGGRRHVAGSRAGPGPGRGRAHDRTSLRTGTAGSPGPGPAEGAPRCSQTESPGRDRPYRGAVPTGRGENLMRTSILGGEIAGRGLLGKVDGRTGAALGATALVAVWLWLGLGGVAGTSTGLGVAAAGTAVLFPWNGQRSPAAGWVRGWRFLLRCRRGVTTYTAGPGGAEPVLPGPLGRVTPLELAGTAHEDMFVLRHANPGEPPYLSVVLEVEGQPQRLRTVAEFEAASARYGVMLSQLARDGSFIRGLQQVNHILPHDPARHRAFVAARVADRPGIEALVSSYEDLIDLTTHTAEQHRNYLMARFPLTGEFAAAARRYGRGEAGWAGLVREELARLTELVGRADLVRPRVLGEQRTCAVLRSMQDPSYPVDQHEGVRWSNCWQDYRSERGHLAVNDRWLHRVAVVPPDAVAAVPLGPHWLAPLLVEVNPAVIRTLSVRMEFVPARVARARAVRDVAVDGASRHNAAVKGQIGDGTDEALLSASRWRLDDLTPGSGHHGVNWTMALPVTAADPAELASASTRVANAAANCAIGRLEWQDTWHDAAAIATYPLARGMAVTG
jgi:hypothetical protein